MDRFQLRKKERRRWQGSALLATCGLVLGAVGVAPAVADLASATCTVTVDQAADTALWSWADAPDGLPLVPMYGTADGDLVPISVGASSSFAGYGPAGTWGPQSPVADDAVSFHLWADPEKGGGLMTCDVEGTAPAQTTLQLTSGAGESNPGFQTGGCSPSPDDYEYGWKFWLSIDSSKIISLEATFENAGTITDFIIPSHSDRKAYIHTPGPDTLVSATAVIEGSPETRLVLGHVCTPPDAPTPTTTAAPAPTTTDNPTTPPVTDPPATDPPATDPPATDPPATDPPATDPPATDPPATDPPATDPPATDPPATDPPATDPPATDPPATDPPATTSPATTTPATTDAPTTTLDSDTDPAEPDSGSADIGGEITLDCDADKIIVNVSNTGDAPGVATIMINGETADVVPMNPGDTRMWMTPLTGADSYDVSVSDGDGVVTAASFDEPCAEPQPDTSAEILLNCSAERLVVNLTNSGSGPDTITVMINGENVETVTLAAGESLNWRYDITENADYDVKVTNDDGVLAAESFTSSCFDPTPNTSAQAPILDCDEGELIIPLTNDGDGPSTVTITVNGTTQTVTLDPGQSLDVTFPMDEPGDYAITVVADGTTLIDQTVTSDCSTPEPNLAADITLDCDAGKVTVIVTNSGDGAGTAIVEIDGEPTTLTVPAGGDAMFMADVADDAPLDVVVSDGEVVLDELRAPDAACSTPTAILEATAAVQCATGEVVVTIDNTGNAAGVALIAIDGDEIQLTVPAGETQQYTADVSATADVNVVVSGPGPDGPAELLNDTIQSCEVPASMLTATISLDCDSGEVVVNAMNTGNIDGELTITVDGEDATLVVKPGEKPEWRTSIELGVAHEVRVSDGNEVIALEEFDSACVVQAPEITAEIAADCDNERIMVRVINSGGADGTVEIEVNGEITTVDVASGTYEVLAVPVTDDVANYDIAVIVNGEEVQRETVNPGCTTPVTESPTAALANSCARNELLATMTNPTGSAVDFQLDLNSNSQTVTVEPGESTTVALVLAEDVTYSARVTQNGTELAAKSFIHNCKGAAAKVAGRTQRPTTQTTAPAFQLARTGANTPLIAVAGGSLLAAGLVAQRAGAVRGQRLAADEN